MTYHHPTMLTHEDTLTARERARDKRGNRIADLESALEDISCAYRMLAGEDDDIADELDRLGGMVRTRLIEAESGL